MNMVIRCCKQAMNKTFNNRVYNILNNTVYFRNSNIKDSLLPITPVRFQHKFFPHVYGLSLTQHVLHKKTVNLNEEQYKFFQRNSPNYIVTLVKKTIESSSSSSDIKYKKSQQDSITSLDNFYRIASYCHVHYQDKNNITLSKIYKVKIEELNKVDIIKENNQNTILIDIDQDKIHKQVDLLTVQGQVQGQGQAQAQAQAQAQGNVNIKTQTIPPKDKANRKKGKNMEINRNSQVYSLVTKQIDETPKQFQNSLQFKILYLIDLLKQYFERGPWQAFQCNFHDIGSWLDDLAARILQSRKPEIVQSYLESNDLQEKTQILIKVLKKANIFNQKIVDLEMIAKREIRNKYFFEYFNELFKAAKNTFEGKKSKELFLEKAMNSFKNMNAPKEIKDLFNKQVQKYSAMDQNSMQAGVVKAYIQQLSKIPYDVKSNEAFDLEYAQRVMDEEHYGMKEVKDAIMEIIAVGKLKKSLKGKIFCFIGGPGLGKTSFAKSVAKALNRNFYNISLGGVSDSSVLKGHRRTYQGAYSGKIIEALKFCGTSNPVILLDEVDKMGNSYHGDPRSELLEILDPNQNSSFVDNYLDVPVDLSNVLFITSANYERNISKPLLDRMEKVYLTSYTKFQKVQIFNRHLLRRAIEKTGVNADNFSLPPAVIEALIEEYSLGEPGVRYLQKSALNLLQKVAFKMMTKEEQLPIQITKQNLHTYLGNSFFRRKDHSKIGKGVAISLGGGSYGSRLTYIEAFKKSYISQKDVNRGTLFTGSLGDVFREAMNISYTYARNFLYEKASNRYLFENEVHVHAPQGGFKKDGSTDSLTIVTALVSLALNKKVKPGVAMTGEITLYGQILLTHSVKEKVMVAKKQGIHELILPKGNEPDVQNLSADVKEGITFHFIRSFEEAYPLLFTNQQVAQVAVQATQN